MSLKRELEVNRGMSERMGFPETKRKENTDYLLSEQNESSVASSVPYALEIRDLSKRFRRHTLKGKGSYTTIKSALLTLFRKQKEEDVIYTDAVKNLTLRVPSGSSVGLIGRNGSGKSSLLKLITGIYKPDVGSVSVHGRVAALIELGAGFHPDFTGRENLYLGGIMYGLSRKEIDERFNAIVQFAELEEVIDDPVRTYSSGMFMRLGFSLAIHVDPDVLLIDEVLSVGDAGFTSKCKERITKLRKDGKTLLMVSHDLDAVERWCDEVLWIHKGEVKDRGEPRRVIDQYLEYMNSLEEAELFKESEDRIEAQEKQVHDNRDSMNSGTDDEVIRWGGRELELLGCELLGKDNTPHLVYDTEDPCTIVLSYTMHEPVKNVVFGIAIHRTDGVLVYGSNTAIEKVEFPELPESGEVSIHFDRLGFLEGEYRVDIAAHSDEGYPYDYHKHLCTFRMKSKTEQVGVCEPPHTWSLQSAGEEV